MNKRRKFEGASIEALEDRQLLSTGAPGAFMNRALQGAAQFLNQGNGRAAVRAPGNRLAMSPGRAFAPRGPLGAGNFVTPAAVGSGFTIAQPNTAISPNTPRLNGGPAVRASLPTTTTPSIQPTSEYVFNPLSVGLGSNGLPLRSPAPTTPRARSTPEPILIGSSQSTASIAPMAPVAPTATGGSSLRMIAPVGDPADDSGFVPIPYDVLDGATLSDAQEATLRQAAADLVANHTLGADATKDKAAVSAFQGTLDDLAMSIWSQVNATTKASAVAMKDAAATFADDYTAGADPAQDEAAWKAFNTSLNAFTRSIQNPNAPSVALPVDPMGDGPWFSPPMMMAGSGVKYLASGLLDGQPVNKDDLLAVQNAVNAFTDSYSNGQNAADDLAAGEKLLNDLGDAMSRRWERLAPPEWRDLAAVARPAFDALAARLTTTSTVTKAPVTPVAAPTGLASGVDLNLA